MILLFVCVCYVLMLPIAAARDTALLFFHSRVCVSQHGGQHDSVMGVAAC